MKKSLSRSVALTAAAAAGIAGALVATPSATAVDSSEPTSAHARAADKLVRTGFGYRADVFGTKVVVDGVELRGLKDGYAMQRCTAMAGRVVEQESTISLPDELIPEGLIDVSLSRQTSQTYRKDGRHGVLGVSTIADVAIGGEVPGLGELPQIHLEGLQSVANAYHEDGEFKHEESFGFKGLTIDLTQDTPISNTLEVLFDTLGLSEVVKTVNVTVNQLVTTLLEIVKRGLGDSLVIPGLGTIGLGNAFGSATENKATSEAYALRIGVQPEGFERETVLQLGRARTRIAKVTPGAGVFRGTTTGANLLGDLPMFSLGNLGQRSLPCEGTNGKLAKTEVANYTILGAQGNGLVNVTGVQYRWKGDQHASGLATGMMGTALGKVEVPSVGLTLEGVDSQVNLRKPAGTGKVQRSVKTTVAKIVLGDKEIALSDVIAAGDQGYDLGNDNRLFYRRVYDSNYYGTGVHTLQVMLAGIGILDLGTSAARIFSR